ncbi:uncharacterized protein LOC132256357 [Phlebotomus argentipes]|uniref:uncharacterized protein LOC132256357 n=1 Tax=Phlebotomus argentipes TaxID=94469 RepID=UPI0028935853|nr:uncharacterized protein LOC132256357 [Phlebotomus argentipes]
MYLTIAVALLVVYSGVPSSGASGIAEEASHLDMLQFWQTCKHEAEIKTLIVKAAIGERIIFANHSNLTIQECYNRLRHHTFLWIDAQMLNHSVEKSFILVKRTQYEKLNLDMNPPKLYALTKSARRWKLMLLLEVQPKIMRVLNVTKETFWKREENAFVKNYNYSLISNEQKIELKHRRRICLDFGGFARLNATGDIRIRDLRKTLCRRELIRIRFPNEGLEKNGQISGVSEIVANKVEVEIQIHTSHNTSESLILSALMTETNIKIIKPIMTIN